MDCKVYMDMMSEALDGQADKESMERFENHLSKCEKCRRIFRRMASLRAGMMKMGNVEPPEPFGKGWRAKLQTERQAKPGAHVTRWVSIAAGAVAAVVLMLIGVQMLWLGGESPFRQAADTSSGIMQLGEGFDEKSAATEAPPLGAAPTPKPLMDDTGFMSIMSSSVNPVIEIAGKENACPQLLDMLEEKGIEPEVENMEGNVLVSFTLPKDMYREFSEWLEAEGATAPGFTGESTKVQILFK
ncbi:MAG: zf-HC2 domain-containing protein [Bacillota bacterium]|nr:zf-HC2 domain-containing protein [Bacillota bacterium]